MARRASLELSFTHTRLLVTNYPACVRFYRDVLEFDLTWGDEQSGYADFQTGETTLALFDQAAMADAVGDEPREQGAAPDQVTVVFGVECVDTIYEGLRDRVEVVTTPHDRPDWGIRVAHARDPAGTLLEINEPLEDA